MQTYNIISCNILKYFNILKNLCFLIISWYYYRGITFSCKGRGSFGLTFDQCIYFSTLILLWSDTLSNFCSLNLYSQLDWIFKKVYKRQGWPMKVRQYESYLFCLSPATLVLPPVLWSIKWCSRAARLLDAFSDMRMAHFLCHHNKTKGIWFALTIKQCQSIFFLLFKKKNLSFEGFGDEISMGGEGMWVPPNDERPSSNHEHAKPWFLEMSVSFCLPMLLPTSTALWLP